MGAALHARGALDRAMGIALEDCPFRNQRLAEAWRLGWLASVDPFMSTNGGPDGRD